MRRMRQGEMTFDAAGTLTVRGNGRECEADWICSGDERDLCAGGETLSPAYDCVTTADCARE